MANDNSSRLVEGFFPEILPDTQAVSQPDTATKADIRQKNGSPLQSTRFLAHLIGLAAVSLDAFLSWDGYRLTFGGDPLAALIGAIIPLAGFASVSLAVQRRSLTAAFVAVTLILASAAGNWLSLTGRVANATFAETEAGGEKKTALENAQRAQATLQETRQHLVSDRDQLSNRLADELRSGKGRRAVAAEEALLRAEKAIREFDESLPERAARTPSAIGAADERLLSARHALPPHIKAIRMLPEQFQSGGESAMTGILALLLAWVGPALGVIALPPGSCRRKWRA